LIFKINENKTQLEPVSPVVGRESQSIFSLLELELLQMFLLEKTKWLGINPKGPTVQLHPQSTL
jgi:hypothetical protein